MTNGNTPCISGGYANMMTEEDSDLIRRSDALGCFHDWVDKYGDVHTPDEMAEYRAIEELPSVEQEKRTEKRTETHACDCVSRQAAIEAIKTWGLIDGLAEGQAIEILADEEKLPSAQPEVLACGEGELSAQPEIKPIDYHDCANAMLRMWMDKVVTDGEYNRIMDKLNAFWGTRNERSDRQASGD